MWATIFSAVSSIFKGWVSVKKSKQEAEAAYHMALAKGEQDWDLEAQKAARYSWKDEFITIVWFAPLIMAWWDEERATKWIAFAEGMPYWYQFGMFGIIAASFGLRWYFKQQSFKVKEK
jgi:hypothetical protein